MLESEIERSDWRGHACSLLMATIDNIESFNLKSEDAPEETLRTFTRITRQEMRPGDIIGRTGDSELALILPETDITQAEALGREILSGLEWYFTISVGVACFPVHAANGTSLLERVRAAMEAAVERGGNRVVHLDDTLPGANGSRGR